MSEGIMRALPLDRAAHYARFIHDYETIRAAEGRGSENDSFYLGLPYIDSTRRNGGQWRIRARSFNYLRDEVLNEYFQGNVRSVLDLGAGNCWMSYRLALAGFRPFAVDLLTNPNDGLGAAEHYRKHLPVLFPRIQADLSTLPFQDGQFDAAIFNASLHYAEDEEAALREALRCLRSGGILAICDTPWYSREESGRRMVFERRAAFLQRYGTASDSIQSMEYLTDNRLRSLENRLGIRWAVHSPSYGIKWTIRPLVARLHNRREPSRFRSYVARKSL
jgi:SAM-dependent methyltransferase